eukprot:TRINITY_DN9085_c0_g1_i2.p1 TRINITY_DN9085_c0_g1~~TRINITY_DN9085_c0_g1_i2.p1  ORF type:complete len:285 (-),score=46.48 TRINITY_DN9085_c0_g1_i2:271-1125(-)
MAQNHVFLGMDYETYYPGKPVEGLVVLLVRNQNVHLTDLTLYLKGEESTISLYPGIITKNEYFKDKTIAFEEQIIIEQHLPLEKGTHTFSFSIDLPPNLPGYYEETESESELYLDTSNFSIRSFGQDKSWIRYSAQVVANIRDEKPLIQTKYFPVVEAFDIEILTSPPLVKQNSDSFFLSGGPISLSASIANGGVMFCGQKLYVNILVNNTSNRTIDALFVHVDQQTIYRGKSDDGMTSTTHNKTVAASEISNSKIRAQQMYDKDLVLEITSGLLPSIRYRVCL